MPQFYQPPAIMVNKRVLESAGVTAADLDTSKPDVLVAALTKMTKASGGNPTTIGLDIQPTGQANLWMLGLGGKLVGEDGAPTLDDPNNAKVLAVMKQLTDAQGGYAKLKSFTDSFDTFGGKNQFVKDQVGAQIMPQWFVNVLTPYADDVDISAVPFKDASGQPFTVAGGSAFVIPENAKNPDAALIPNILKLSNYSEVWSELPLLYWLGNSIVIALLAAGLVALSSSVVTFGFAYFRFPGRRLLFGLILATMMLPGAVTLVPQYLIWKNTGLLGTTVPLGSQPVRVGLLHLPAAPVLPRSAAGAVRGRQGRRRLVLRPVPPHRAAAVRAVVDHRLLVRVPGQLEQPAGEPDLSQCRHPGGLHGAAWDRVRDDQVQPDQRRAG